MEAIKELLAAAAYGDNEDGPKYSRIMLAQYVENMSPETYNKLCEELAAVVTTNTAFNAPRWGNQDMKEAFMDGQKKPNVCCSTWFANMNDDRRLGRGKFQK